MVAMIGGREIQGIGGAGIGVLCEIVICDLVPLRERGTYMGVVFGMVGIGAALGPLFGGLGAFIVLEGNARLTPNPIIPLHLFGYSISSIVLLLTCLHDIVTMWALYFLPVYFQGVLAVDAYHAGIDLLPTILALLPGAIIGGLLLSKFGRYKPILVFCFTLIGFGFGIFTILDENSSTGAWVGFQVLESFGAGFGMAAMLPALLAPLTDKDTALATATWGFMRSFGVMWGVAIAGTIYTNRAAQLAGSGAIGDAAVAAEFMAGGAYGAAEVHFLDSLSAQTRAQVISVQSTALQRSWQVAIAFGAVGLIAAAVMKQVPLRKENDTDFGMVEKKDNSTEEEARGTTGKEAPAAAS